MKEETIWAIGVWVFAVLWTVGIGWVAGSWIVMIWALLGFVIASGAVLWIRANERKKQKLREKLWREESLEIIQRKRHDWLNDLQLIYGYIRLNKYDKLPTFVESLKHSLQHESMLALLKSNLLEWELLLYLIKGNGMKVQVHVDPEWNADKWLIEEETTARLLREWMDIVQNHLEANQSTTIHIHFTRQEEKSMIMLKHTGTWGDMNWEEMVRLFVRSWPKISIKQHINSEGLRLELMARGKVDS